MINTIISVKLPTSTRRTNRSAKVTSILPLKEKILTFPSATAHAHVLFIFIDVNNTVALNMRPPHIVWNIDFHTAATGTGDQVQSKQQKI